MKHGLIVEKIAKERKLRHVFLFNDIIISAKQKIAHRFLLVYFPELLRVEVTLNCVNAICAVLALDLEGVHDVKLHHPSSSVATSNQ